MNLSKSRYCNAVQCVKMLWLLDNKTDLKSEIDNQSVLDNGTEVGELARDLFGQHIDIEFDKNLQNMIDNTKKVLEENKKVILCEASFNYNDNFCSVDILKKENDDYYIYEVKSSTEVKGIYLEDVSYQTYVLKNLGLNVKKSFIIHINSKYERNGELELDKLFKINDVTDKVDKILNTIEDKILVIKNVMNSKSEPDIDIDNYCFKPYDCPYFNYCTRNLPENNIFKLRRIRNNLKIKYYKEGIYDYKDLLNENIDSKVKEQIEFELYNLKDKIDKDKIKEFLNTLSYPLYYLDFETFQDAIPKYSHEFPYEQIPFQYSLHYEEIDGELKHKEFLAKGNYDPRRELAERLVLDIPKNVCVLAYNMSFEKRVIKRLAEIYSDLSEHLMNIYSNIRDLMIPFYNHDYYSKDMDGSYSIKYVLPSLFPNDKDLDYHNLDMVHNGSEAMNAYKELENLNDKEREILRQNMLKYCELDTYAMVKIYKKLKKIR